MHTVVTTSWLNRNGFTNSNIQKYVQSNWIESIGAGAYKRPYDSVEWEGGIYGLQQQHPEIFHVGGKSALEKHGLAHYISFGKTPLFLFTCTKQSVPFWVKNFMDQHEMVQQYFFSRLLPPVLGLTLFDCGEFEIKISSRERAALEMVELVGEIHSFEECRLTFENLTTLRPQLVQELLQKCTSVKAKRVFLFLSERLDLPWMKHINGNEINLGIGSRQLTPQGFYDSRYKITYPKDLFANDELGI